MNESFFHLSTSSHLTSSKNEYDRRIGGRTRAIPPTNTSKQGSCVSHHKHTREVLGNEQRDSRARSLGEENILKGSERRIYKSLPPETRAKKHIKYQDCCCGRFVGLWRGGRRASGRGRLLRTGRRHRTASLRLRSLLLEHRPIESVVVLKLLLSVQKTRWKTCFITATSVREG